MNSIINDLQQAKSFIQDGIHRLNVLETENKDLRFMLYRLADKYGLKLSERELCENEINFVKECRIFIGPDNKLKFKLDV